MRRSREMESLFLITVWLETAYLTARKRVKSIKMVSLRTFKVSNNLTIYGTLYWTEKSGKLFVGQTFCRTKFSSLLSDIYVREGVTLTICALNRNTYRINICPLRIEPFTEILPRIVWKYAVEYDSILKNNDSLVVTVEYLPVLSPRDLRCGCAFSATFEGYLCAFFIGVFLREDSDKRYTWNEKIEPG